MRWASAVLFAAALLLICFFGDGALEGSLRWALNSGVLLSGVAIALFHLASFLGRTISSRAQARVAPGTLMITAGPLAAVGMTGALLSTTTWGSVAGMLVAGFAISPVVPTAVNYTYSLVSPIVVGTIALTAGLRTGLVIVVPIALGIALLGTRWPNTDNPHDPQATSTN